MVVKDDWVETAALDAGMWGRAQKKYTAILMLGQVAAACQMVMNVFMGRAMDVRCLERVPVSGILGTNTTMSQADICDTSKCARFTWAENQWVSYVSTFSLFCGDSYRTEVVQSMTMFGVLVGAPLWGVIADRIGRRQAMMACLLLVLTVTIGAGMAQSLVMYTLCRAIAGFGAAGYGIASFVLASEMLAARHRATFSIAMAAMFGVGIAVYALMASQTDNWRTLMLYVVILYSVTTLLHWSIPESYKWLASQGQNDQARRILRHIAKINKKETALRHGMAGDHRIRVDKSEDDMDDEELWDHQTGDKAALITNNNNSSVPLAVTKSKTPVPEDNQQGISALFGHALALRWLLIQMMSWMASSMVYYGLTMASGQLSSNFYMSVALSGFAELPGYVVVTSMQNRVGRRWLFSGPLILASVSCMLVTRMPALALIAKAGVSASFSVVWLHSAELFPTNLRNGGLGVCSMAARVGGMTAPVIPMVIKAYHMGAVMDDFGVFACIGLTSAVLHLMLPETYGKQMPGTIDQMIALA